MASNTIDRHRHGENNAIDLVLSSTSHSTSGKTVSAYLVSESGTAVLVGSQDGAAAGTPITVSMDYSLVTPGTYELEVIANPNDANPILMLPNENTADRIMIIIRDQRGA
jgi:hypothetical protein